MRVFHTLSRDKRLTQVCREWVLLRDVLCKEKNDARKTLREARLGSACIPLPKIRHDVH